MSLRREKTIEHLATGFRNLGTFFIVKLLGFLRRTLDLKLPKRVNRTSNLLQF